MRPLLYGRQCTHYVQHAFSHNHISLPPKSQNNLSQEYVFDNRYTWNEANPFFLHIVIMVGSAWEAFSNSQAYTLAYSLLLYSCPCRLNSLPSQQLIFPWMKHFTLCHCRRFISSSLRGNICSRLAPSYSILARSGSKTKPESCQCCGRVVCNLTSRRYRPLRLQTQIRRAASTDVQEDTAKQKGNKGGQAKKNKQQQGGKGGKASELKVTPRSEDFSR